MVEPTQAVGFPAGKLAHGFAEGEGGATQLDAQSGEEIFGWHKKAKADEATAMRIL